MSRSATIEVVTRIGPDEMAAALRDDARRGLTDRRKHLPSRWFYDERGSELFSAITRLPEYYPTRREREILRARAATIARRSGADTLVELGSGTSGKTRLLLDAFTATGRLQRFVALDVSDECLRDTARTLCDEYPGLGVVAVVADFERHLDAIPDGGRRCVAFLGSTIGNLDPAGRARFYADLADELRPGDSFLLGTDLRKDPRRLVAAYDDAEGVTAEFNRNVLHVLNRELGADFEPDRFEHVARWDDVRSWMAMSLRSTVAQTVTVAALDLMVDFAEGEELHTEISAKFDRPMVEPELATAGFSLGNWWTDTAGDFALSLWFRDERAAPAT